MSYNQPHQPFSIPSAVDYRDGSCKYRFFDINASGLMVRASAGGRALGINVNLPDVGDPGEQYNSGLQQLELGGSITAGDSLKSDSTGRGVTAAAGAVAAGQAHAIAIESGSVGELITVYICPAASMTLATGSETLTGAGAIGLTTETTDWVATSDNATMANGLYVGQHKTIRAATGTTGSNVLTPATVSADAAGGSSPATVTYTAEGQETEWKWLADGWKLIRITQAGVATVATAATANPLVAKNDLATDGTDVAVLADGAYPGQTTYFNVISVANTPVQTISGKFFDEDGSADGITVNFVAAAIAIGNMFRGTWSGARWIMTSHINATITT